jgi:hypothetical protein
MIKNLFGMVPSDLTNGFPRRKATIEKNSTREQESVTRQKNGR